MIGSHSSQEVPLKHLECCRQTKCGVEFDTTSHTLVSSIVVSTNTVQEGNNLKVGALERTTFLGLVSLQPVRAFINVIL